jgi:hypothetical protein
MHTADRIVADFNNGELAIEVLQKVINNLQQAAWHLVSPMERQQYTSPTAATCMVCTMLHWSCGVPPVLVYNGSNCKQATSVCVCVLQPTAITAKRMGVGACLWEGELLLAAYLSELPLPLQLFPAVVATAAYPAY